MVPSVHSGEGNGIVPPGDKPFLSEPLSTKLSEDYYLMQCGITRDKWVDDLCRSPRPNEFSHWKYIKVNDVMVNPSCPKTPTDPSHHLSHCNFHIMSYKKCETRSWIENELIELINSDQFRLSILIQFQFKIFQFNSNSIHAELNWIDYQFQFNSWIDPSPDHGH